MLWMNRITLSLLKDITSFLNGWMVSYTMFNDKLVIDLNKFVKIWI